MNRNKLVAVRNGVRTRYNAMVAGLTALALPGLAFAQDTFDTAAITTKITTYAGYALVILLAFAAAIWGLRAAGLIGKR